MLEERRRAREQGDEQMRQGLAARTGHHGWPGAGWHRMAPLPPDPESETDPWDEVERRRQEARAVRSARRAELRQYIALRRGMLAHEVSHASGAPGPPARMQELVNFLVGAACSGWMLLPLCSAVVHPVVVVVDFCVTHTGEWGGA